MTDFGLKDPFVGIMKGIIRSQCSQALLLDLTHQIPPQDISTAAFYLMVSFSYFPGRSLFMVVVDPGVGSDRKIIWARSKQYQFLAPDNGILSWVEVASPQEKFEEVRQVENQKLFIHPISSTFHGRDIFSPVAGALLKGLSPKALGPLQKDYKRVPFPEPKQVLNRASGRVIGVDRFGNVITNLTDRHVALNTVFYLKGRMVAGLKPAYSSVKEGEALALIGSFHFVELSVRNGSFAEMFGVRVGDPIEAILV
ncbi:MAG: SAM-dependent chlorinase/fluorinase [Elusimicrobia bacterium]|nr:SAM-dependent chlorinase/fluorinase [Elusimicrobiota bacterium]